MIEIEYIPIAASALRHPLEYELELNAQKDGTVDHITKQIGNISLHARSLPQMMLTGYPVDEDTYPRLEKIYETVLKRLKCEERFPLFVDYGYDLTAKSFGSGKNGHMIVVNSSCLEELNDGELKALLGHEVGHIMMGHIQYREFLDSIHFATNKLPIAGNIIKKKIDSFFSKWCISSEYSADRAALIASQSYEYVASLLMRQIGITPNADNIKTLLKQKIPSMPQDMGVSYMLIAQAFKSSGMVDRIQQLYCWVDSEEFLKNYPFIHYMAKAFIEKHAFSENEENLIRLHRRAFYDNRAAQEMLADLYKTGSTGLPKAYEPYFALIKSAAFLGSGTAQYVLYVLFHNHFDFENVRIGNRLIEQLILSAASRDESKEQYAVKEAEKYQRPIRLTFLAGYVKAFVKQRGKMLCDVNLIQPGCPLSPETVEKTLSAFWMMRDDKIYAMDIEMIDGVCCGTAISDNGIYMRSFNCRYPSMISWNEFTNEDLYVQSDGHFDYLVCNKRKISERNLSKEMVGSINDIIFGLKKECDKRKVTMQ